MFKKLAEDIEKRYWQKLAALEKEAAKWKGSVKDPSLAMLKRQQGIMSKIDPYSKPGYKTRQKEYTKYNDLEIDNAINHQGDNVLRGTKFVKAPSRVRSDHTEKSKGIMGSMEGRAALDTFLHTINKDDADFVRKVIKETAQGRQLSQDDYSRLLRMDGGTDTGAFTDGLSRAEKNVFSDLHPNVELSAPMTMEEIAKKISDRESGDVFSRRGFRDNVIHHLMGNSDSAFFAPPHFFDNRFSYSAYPGNFVGLISKSKSKPAMTTEEFNDSFRISGHSGNKHPKLRRYLENLEVSDPDAYEITIQRPVLQRALDNGSAGFYKDLGGGMMAPVSIKYPDQSLAGRKSSNIQAPALNTTETELSGRQYPNTPEYITELIRDIVNGHPINYYTDDSFLQNIPYNRFLP